MSRFTKTVTAAFAVLALGTAVLATTSADASPRHGGGRHGGWHGGHGGGHWGGHGGGWGRPVYWGGGYGGPLLGSNCRIVVRYDVYGDPIGRRRVCFPGY
jgi:uncharacterized membrane protein